jgi:lipoprotein signal peptidase
LFVLTIVFPAYGWFAGVLVGGSFSHLLETTLRGWVVDYVRLPFWPAFNFADMAITLGALGILVRLVTVG